MSHAFITRWGRAAVSRLILLVVVGWLALTAKAFAVRPDEMLADPALEHRARLLGQDLRCLVCQNQSIDDSDASLAHDLRVLLRQRLLAGDSDAQAKQYLVDRYGDYVLLKPPFNGETVLLWLGPAFLFGLATAALLIAFRRHAAGGTAGPLAAPPPLSEEEQSRLATILGHDGPQQDGLR